MRTETLLSCYFKLFFENEIDSKEEFIQSLEERKDKKSKPGWSDYINRIPGAQYISTKYQDWASNTENEEVN